MYLTHIHLETETRFSDQPFCEWGEGSESEEMEEEQEGQGALAD